MIPSATTLPLPAPAPERADLLPSTDGDNRSDANALSFASHLDQFVTPVRPQNAAPSAQCPTATRAQRNAAPTAHNADQTGKATANAQASADAQDQSAASSADGDASTSDGTDDSASKSVGKKEQKEANEDTADQDKQTAATNSISISTVPLPLTPGNLAITNGIAPTPILAQQTNETAPLPNAPTVSASLSLPGASVPAVPLNLSNVSLSGVSMDSRVAVQTAAPGVGNALAQNAVPSAQVSLLSLPAQTTPAVTSTNSQAVSIANMVNMPQTPDTASPALLNLPVAANTPAETALLNAALPQAPSTPGQQATASSPKTLQVSASSVQQTIALAVPTASTSDASTAATAALQVPVSLGQQTTATQSDTQATPAPVLPTANAGTVQETISKAPVSLSEETPMSEKDGGEKTVAASTAGTSVTAQHLGSIERLFTLTAGKSANSRTNQVSGASVPAVPLNLSNVSLSGVSMDSRVAVQTAAPGVGNALAQNAVPSAQVSLLSLPAQTTPAVTSTNSQAVSIANTVNMPQTPDTASPALLNLPAENTIHSAVLPSVPAPVELTATSALAQPTLITPSATQTAPSSVLPTGSVTSNVAQETSSRSAVSEEPQTDEKVVGEKTAVSAAEASTAGISVTEQHLGGIERLFTLAATRSADSKTAPAIEAQSGKSDAPTITPATAALLTQNASDRQPIPGSVAAQAHSAATGNGVNAASPSLAALSTPASDQAPVLQTSLVSPTLAAGAAGEMGALLQPADGIRNPNGATALSSTGSATGANGGAGGVFLASVGAQGKTGGDTSADGESQSDSHREEAARTTAENKTNSAAQPNSANPFSSLRTAGETTAANAVTAPNGSSQIARAQVVEQVTRHLESMRIANGEGEMRLRLAPQHLGNVQISVASHQEGVVARIAVESTQIQQAMEGGKEHLRSTLEARGLRVSSVEVTVTPNAIGNDGAAFAGQRNGQSLRERAETAPSYSRPTSGVQAVSDNLAPVPIAAAVASVSHSRLDYRA